MPDTATRVRVAFRCTCLRPPQHHVEFLDNFTCEVEKLTFGSSLDPATDIGSMVDDEAAERVVNWAAAGATITTGVRRDGDTMGPMVVAAPPTGADRCLRWGKHRLDRTGRSRKGPIALLT
ncbi:aldehyde dehydrogenase family protein [Micromonospora radicis]|uniref:aldehyde dehydrogenase family protein n=1 Tax=Micromonospora radicis TaxID=1894971 RepID=UPI002279985E|nr:aldehyde dehydrogenase family protein [Micromonospora radicis]